MNNNKVICRPCKEENNWEIQEPNGKVSKTHYYSKQACVTAGKKMAEEYACELVVTDEKENMHTNNKTNTTNKFNRNNDIY